MDQQSTTKDRQKVLRGDFLFASSMFVVCCIYITGLITAPFWVSEQRQKVVSANATSTAFAVATRQANVTATAIARTTEQAHYELIDRFDTNKNNWRRGAENNKYWDGYTTLKDGVYLWNVRETKDTFISWADFSTNDHLDDFDVYVDTKVLNTAPGDVCSGFIFRESPEGWDAGGYYFALCNNPLVKISYHTEKNGWESIASIPVMGHFKDWNRLEITARGTHFTFLINGDQIYEMDDDRQKVGGLALVIELNEKVSAQILFDNFGYQSR